MCTSLWLISIYIRNNMARMIEMICNEIYFIYQVLKIMQFILHLINASSLSGISNLQIYYCSTSLTHCSQDKMDTV